MDRCVNGGGFLTTKKSERPQLLCKRFIADLQSSYAPSPAPHGIGFGALVATEIENEPCLVEFATTNFQPEYREKRSFFVSMGSGQPLADPFLAFLSRVLWKTEAPNVRLGRFGVYWALKHTIALAPGTVGGAIKIAVLSRNDAGWRACFSADNEEAEQFIDGVEARIGSLETEPSTPLPDPPPIPQMGA